MRYIEENEDNYPSERKPSSIDEQNIRGESYYRFRPPVNFKVFKPNMKLLKRALIIAVLAFIVYHNREFITDSVRFMEIVNENDVTIDELTEAIKGMVPEKNNNINEYNDMLDKLIKSDLNEEVKVDDLLDKLTLHYEEEDKSFTDDVKDVLTKDSEEESEQKYMVELDKNLTKLKNYSIDTPDYESKGIGESIADGWTTICSLFGGRTVEEKDEGKATNILETLVDFAFYDTEIKGIKFEDLSYQHKKDTLDVILYSYRSMERRFDKFKDHLDEDTIYPTLEARIIIFEEYLEQTEKLDENYTVIKGYLGNVNYGDNSILKKIQH